MQMRGKRRIVVAGDNLWNIAKAELGAGRQWPRIWRYNNRRDVIRATGRGVPDPDLIYVGQVLLIPTLPGARPVIQRKASPPPQNLAPAAPAPSSPPLAPFSPRPPLRPPFSPFSPRPPSSASSPRAPSPQPLRNGPLGQQLPHIESPVSFKYRLDDIMPQQYETPTARVEFRMTGDVLLMSRKAYPATYVTSRRELEAQINQEMYSAFGKLMNDTRFIYDPAQKRVTVRTMLVSQSTMPNVPSTAIGVEMPSNSPFPKLRAEIRLPKLEGSFEGFLYAALDVKFVVEITPRAQPPLTPSPQPLRQREPDPEPGYNWGRLLGIGLIVTAGAIVTATIVEDFYTFGAGVADDPASFSAAGLALARGLALLRGASALPRAAAATVVIGAGAQHAR
jgi:hypothetical protein